MKDKQKSLEDLDFLTELTPSEQEEINGGTSNDLTSPRPKPIIVGGGAQRASATYVPPDDEDDLYKQPLNLTPNPIITL